MEKLRIAMVTYLFPPTFSGGARHAIELAKALRVHGVESFFIGANLENAPDYEVYEGLPVYRMKTRNRKRIDYMKYSLKVCRKLISKRKSFHIIHLHSLVPFYFLIIAVGKIMKKPIVLSPTLIGHDDPVSLKKRSFLWRIEGKLYKYYDKIICKSTAVKESCIKAGIQDSIIASIPCAIPCGDQDSLFRPPKGPEEIKRIREKLNLPLNSFLATFVGRVQSRKGCDLLFDAWEEVLKKKQFDGYLLIVGPYDTTLQNNCSEDNNDNMKFINKLKIFLEKSREKRVMFIGTVNHSVVAEYLRASDCFVFPSKRESFGKAVVEAMASGLPTVCTYIPQITDDIIENGQDGVILYDRDPSNLANALLKIKEDEDFRKTVSSKAVDKVYNKFSIHEITTRHLEMYCELNGNLSC